jgi:hypothetical protein
VDLSPQCGASRVDGRWLIILTRWLIILISKSEIGLIIKIMKREVEVEEARVRKWNLQCSLILNYFSQLQQP